jgi:hypothetical protein
LNAGGGLLGTPLPPPQAATIGDKQTSALDFSRDITFPCKSIRQGAYAAHTAGFMHEGSAKNRSRFQEDSYGGAGTR